jgi:hypothetical protein
MMQTHHAKWQQNEGENDMGALKTCATERNGGKKTCNKGKTTTGRRSGRKGKLEMERDESSSRSDMHVVSTPSEPASRCDTLHVTQSRKEGGGGMRQQH